MTKHPEALDAALAKFGDTKIRGVSTWAVLGSKGVTQDDMREPLTAFIAAYQAALPQDEGLVKRLRERAASYDTDGMSSSHTSAILRDAADALEAKDAEIAQLGAELKTVLDREAAGYARHDAEKARLQGEVEAFRGKLAEACGKLIVGQARAEKAEAALKIADDALFYCSLEPGMLRPENNAQHAVASNARQKIATALPERAGKEAGNG